MKERFGEKGQLLPFDWMLGVSLAPPSSCESGRTNMERLTEWPGNGPALLSTVGVERAAYSPDTVARLLGWVSLL